jgi:probable phosphoglycerate mutase
VTELVLIRHAQSEWNAEGRWQGWADPPLSALGQQQATDAGRALAHRMAGSPVPTIAASDLRRAHQTAARLATFLGDGAAAEEILVDTGLREYDVGDWTGLRRDEIVARWPEQLADWDAGRLDAAPGGEDRSAFVTRLFAALERIHRAVPAGPVLAVSHGRAIHAVTDALGGGGGHVGHLTGWRLRLGGAPVLLDSVSLLEPATNGETPREP